jgi:hypothetical protein
MRQYLIGQTRRPADPRHETTRGAEAPGRSLVKKEPKCL